MPAKTLAELPPDAFIGVWNSTAKDLEIFAMHENGDKYYVPNGDALMQIRVELVADGATRMLRSAQSDATQGWGPLIYDIAIEIATKVFDGYLAGTDGLSENSRSIWKYYRDRRNDVERFPLDESHPMRQIPNTVNDEFPFIWKKTPEIVERLHDSGKLRAANSRDCRINILPVPETGTIWDQIRGLLISS